MVKTKNQDTEEKILEAAKEVFQKKGMTGARMQEIADNAGINKALLHYYYRSKEKLFEKVFTAAFRIFFPKIQKIAIAETGLFDKIRFFVKEYISLIQKHPYIPAFIISELNRNPKILIDIFEANIGFGINKVFDIIQKQIDNEVDKNIINPIQVRTLLINIISLTIFPIVAKPIVNVILFDGDTQLYKEFIENRKIEVAEFIINSIKK